MSLRKISLIMGALCAVPAIIGASVGGKANAAVVTKDNVMQSLKAATETHLQSCGLDVEIVKNVTSQTQIAHSVIYQIPGLNAYAPLDKGDVIDYYAFQDFDGAVSNCSAISTIGDLYESSLIGMTATSYYNGGDLREYIFNDSDLLCAIDTPYMDKNIATVSCANIAGNYDDGLSAQEKQQYNALFALTEAGKNGQPVRLYNTPLEEIYDNRDGQYDILKLMLTPATNIPNYEKPYKHFYRKKGETEWKYFTTNNECSDYDTDEKKQVFAGEFCWTDDWEESTVGGVEPNSGNQNGGKNDSKKDQEVINPKTSVESVGLIVAAGCLMVGAGVVAGNKIKNTVRKNRR